MKKEAALSKLHSRLQFVFVLTLFFPTMLLSIFPPELQAEAGKNISMFGLVILCLIVAYLFVELAGDKLPIWVINFSNFLLLCHVACFIPILYVFAGVQKGNLPAVYLYPFGISLMAVLLIPFTLISFLTLFGLFLEVKWVHDFLLGSRKKWFMKFLGK